MSTLNELLEIDPPTRTSLLQADVDVDLKACRATLRHVQRYRFWKRAGGAQGLWEHQRQALAVATAYLHADQTLAREGNAHEAALLKLPTGSGKSGVIAVLARCLPHVRKVMLLTPRAALTEQLLDDVRWRFWSRIGLNPSQESSWALPASEAGAPLEAVYVAHLLPKAAESIGTQLGELKSGRAVIVSTLQSFDEICRDTETLRHSERVKRKVPDDRAKAVKVAAALHDQLRAFDLVVVDEGHYEPAPSWSRDVRGLDRPTILLSATPFRNDYKSFRVRGRFVYNLPIADATEDGIVRSITFASSDAPASAKKAKPRWPAAASGRISDSDRDTTIPQPLTPDDRDAISEFVDLLQRELPTILERAAAYTNQTKVILRAGSYEALVLLQQKLREIFKSLPVLIHHRVTRDHPTARQFHSVRGALSRVKDARFWLHQSKLLEGVDDPTFVAVGILDTFANSRQLVQQIGRVMRSTDPKRKQKQIATVIALPELAADIRARLERYGLYEAHCRDLINLVVQSEAALPDRVLEQMPAYQYVDGDFRAKYLLDGTVRAEDLRVPLRTSIFLTEDEFNPEEAEHELVEAILAEDRFLPRKIADLPEGMFGRTYYAWRNTPFLGEHYLAEWTLGVCIAAQIGPYLFVQDTGGISFDLKTLRIQRPGRMTLLKAFPNSTSDRPVVVTRLSSQSLDMTDRSVRSQAIRTRSFDTTFTDLLDSSLVNTSVYGYVGRKGRYLGITRARLADASDGYVPVREYRAWLQTLHDELERKDKPHRVFDRYAQLVTVNEDEAKPVSILLDLTAETFQEFQVLGDADPGESIGYDMPYDDVCADVAADGTFSIMALDGTPVPCRIEYRPERRRYYLESPALDKRHPPLASPTRKRVTLCEQLNREQAFRILTSKGAQYSRREFFETRDLVTRSGLVPALEHATAVAVLHDTDTEKGETIFNQPAWRTRSILGVIHAICNGTHSPATQLLSDALTPFDILLLDDGSDEIGDFVSLDRTGRRVALIHAKASTKLHHESVTHLQAVGRQVVASLAFCSTQARVNGLRANRWERQYRANKVRLELSRFFKVPAGMAEREAQQTVLAALTNPSIGREVWIVAGRLIDIESVRADAIAKTLTNRRRQLLMFLEGLRTACGRANAQLRIFGH